MTVSYALRDSPEIAVATRERIKAEAKKLGYAPDPVLSALMAYRQAKYPRFQGTLAWVNNYSDPSIWKTNVYLEWFLGAQARAGEMGYKMEEFWLREPKMTPQRFSQILRTRNIMGLVLGPQPNAYGRLHLDWKNFSIVALGCSLIDPRFHLVCNYNYHSTVTVMRRLKRLGYRRIGCMIDSSLDRLVRYQYEAGFLVEQQHIAPKDRIPYVSRNIEGTKLIRWLKTHRPQVVIVQSIDDGAKLARHLKAAGYKIPDDIGIAVTGMCGAETYFAGIDEKGFETGAVAVDLLISLISGNLRGIPETPRHLLIEGKWKQNQTVCPINLGSQ